MRDVALPAVRKKAGINTIWLDMRGEPLTGAAAAAVAAGGGGRGGGGGGQGPAGPPPAGQAGMPVPQPDSGVSALNPCGAPVPGAGGAVAGPLVYPGTYTVSLVAGGKVIDTKSMKVSADPSVQMNDLQAKRYFDMAMDLQDMQRRAGEASDALGKLYPQMTEISGKLGGMAEVPAAVKTQFVAAKTEFDAVRVKFGVPAPAPPAGGGRGGGPPAPPPNPADVAAKVSATRSLLLAFQDNPSDFVVRQYTDLKLSLPKAILEANAVLAKAQTLSTALKAHNITLTVPPAIK
jgi:hypothetical protein